MPVSAAVSSSGLFTYEQHRTGSEHHGSMVGSGLGARSSGLGAQGLGLWAAGCMGLGAAALSIDTAIRDTQVIVFTI
jgi:hypothetical protein